MEMYSFYNDYTHPQAIFETEEGVSGFIPDNIPDGRILQKVIGDLGPMFTQKPSGSGDVSVSVEVRARGDNCGSASRPHFVWRVRKCVLCCRR